MNARGLLPLLLCLHTGCAVSLEGARASRTVGAPVPAGLEERCRELDDSRAAWGAVAVAAGALSGASGVSTLPLGDSRDAQIALASSAAGLAAVGLVATYMAEERAEAWARDCSSR